MLERFNAVAELLRHFYAIMHRSGLSAPVPGNESARKADAIMRRLLEMADLFEEKRNSFIKTSSLGKCVNINVDFSC